MRDNHEVSVVARVAVVGAAGLLAAGCGAARHAAAPTPVAKPAPTPKAVAAVRRCAAGAVQGLGSGRRAYVAYAPHGAVSYRRPGRGVVARFGRVNVNGFPTAFGIVGERVGTDCRARWYRAELPIRPNGATGWIAARAVRLQSVRARIVVDLAARRLTLYRGGRRLFSAAVAVGAPATPTPTGRYYVNQVLVPETAGGPFGPAALGISAYSPVLTGWAQGGPVAIHGTNEPWSIGHAVSNGCIRLPNATLSRLYRVAVAGTPVIIHA
jgi:lipoprotein-anchoring transpeptidase ErfK/SrfK